MNIQTELRRAEAEDIAIIAKLFRLAKELTWPYLPDLHTPEEDLVFFRRQFEAEGN